MRTGRRPHVAREACLEAAQPAVTREEIERDHAGRHHSVAAKVRRGRRALYVSIKLLVRLRRGFAAGLPSRRHGLPYPGTCLEVDATARVEQQPAEAHEATYSRRHRARARQRHCLGRRLRVAAWHWYRRACRHVQRALIDVRCVDLAAQSKRDSAAILWKSVAPLIEQLDPQCARKRRAGLGARCRLGNDAEAAQHHHLGRHVHRRLTRRWPGAEVRDRLNRRTRQQQRVASRPRRRAGRVSNRCWTTDSPEWTRVATTSMTPKRMRAHARGEPKPADGDPRAPPTARRPARAR